jgi:hypothetical protein
MMATYLAVWLVCLAVPAGALPLVMGLELAGCGGPSHTGILRRLLILMPVAALAGVPVLLFLHVGAPAQTGFAAVWFSPLWFAVRGAIVLLLWTVLALASLSPSNREPRKARCIGGLALHAVLATLAATDWIMALAPGLNAAGLGVLLMAAQCGLALSLTLLLCRVPPSGAATLLLVLTGAWAVLHMTQYLVIWSADKPAEIIWYLQRANILGQATVWFGVAALVLTLCLLGPASWRARRGVLATCCSLLLAAHVLEMPWLVLPSLRGGLTLMPQDAAGLAVLAVFGAALAWTLRTRRITA